MKKKLAKCLTGVGKWLYFVPEFQALGRRAVFPVFGVAAFRLEAAYTQLCWLRLRREFSGIGSNSIGPLVPSFAMANIFMVITEGLLLKEKSKGLMLLKVLEITSFLINNTSHIILS